MSSPSSAHTRGGRALHLRQSLNSTRQFDHVPLILLLKSPHRTGSYLTHALQHSSLPAPNANQTKPLSSPLPPHRRGRPSSQSRPEMQMDSYNYASFFHDDAPFYPHVAAPPSPDLPFGLIASPAEPAPPFAPAPPMPMPAAFQDYYPGAVDDAPLPFAAGPNASVPGHQVTGQREQIMEMEAEDGDQERRRTRQQQPAAGGAVESSRGFRHMMRERQRREKLSQSYADLHALVAARSRGDKNSIVQAAAARIRELRGARERLQRRSEELKARILGHDAARQCVRVQFEVDEPASAADSMIGALRRLRDMGVRARGIRSALSGRRLWTEMNVETTIAAGEVEKAVEEALMQEVERKQQLGAGSGSGSAATGFPGPADTSSHVQNVF